MLSKHFIKSILFGHIIKMKKVEGGLIFGKLLGDFDDVVVKRHF
jgi:hypothetical protein